jgi:hypothetical protein
MTAMQHRNINVKIGMVVLIITIGIITVSVTITASIKFYRRNPIIFTKFKGQKIGTV